MLLSQVEIGDCVSFRTEIENQPLSSNEIKRPQLQDIDLFFTLKCDLMFLEADEHDIKNPKNITNRLMMNDDTIKKFTSISTRLYKIHDVQKDYKFRNRKLNEFKNQTETSYRTLETGIRILRLKPNLTKKKNGRNAKLSSQRKFQNLTEFLFSEDKDDEDSVGYLPIEVDSSEIEKMHYTYIQTLINMHEKLKKRYKNYIKKLPSDVVRVLMEDQDCKFQLEPPKLVITHEAPNSNQSLMKLTESRTDLMCPQTGLFQKLNPSIQNKTKQRVERQGANQVLDFERKGAVTTNAQGKQIEGQQVQVEMTAGIGSQSCKGPQPMILKTGKIDRTEDAFSATLGLKVNCLDNLCTKSKLDEMTSTANEDLIKLINSQPPSSYHFPPQRPSNILKRQSDFSLERISSSESDSHNNNLNNASKSFDANQVASANKMKGNYKLFNNIKGMPRLNTSSSAIMDISNISSVLEEKPYEDVQREQVGSRQIDKKYGISFTQFNVSKMPSPNQFKNLIDEEPLCEGFDALPEPLTQQTLTTKSLITQFQQLKNRSLKPQSYNLGQDSNNNSSINCIVVAPPKLLNLKKIATQAAAASLGNKENNQTTTMSAASKGMVGGRFKQKQFSFVQNYSSKIIKSTHHSVTTLNNHNSYSHNKPNTTKLFQPSSNQKTSVQIHVQTQNTSSDTIQKFYNLPNQFRSLSQSNLQDQPQVSITPIPLNKHKKLIIEQEQELNLADLSIGSISFSEQKTQENDVNGVNGAASGINIPSIQVNQRNFEMINSSKSYLGIFLASVRGHKDPHYITKIIDSEIRQISVQIFQLWHKLISIYCSDLKSFNSYLKEKYTKKIQEKVSQMVIRHDSSQFSTMAQSRTSLSQPPQIDSLNEHKPKSINSINNIKQFQVNSLTLNNYVQTSRHNQNPVINSVRSSSISTIQSQVKQPSSGQNFSMNPIVPMFKHKSNNQTLMNQTQFNTQGAASQTQTTNTSMIKNGISNRYSNIMIMNNKKQSITSFSTINANKDSQDDQQFDMPNSPTKITRNQHMIDSFRRKATFISNQVSEQYQSQQNNKDKTVKMTIEDCQKKFRQEYEPLIVEEVYKKGQNKKQNRFNTQRPSSAISVQQSYGSRVENELQKTMITDVFKNLVMGDKTKSDGSEQQQNPNSQSRGIHLFVFVHGFQASSFDMRTLKNFVSFVLPRSICLCSQSNENQTEGSIEQMGQNLAVEVKKFIEEWCYSRDGKTLYLRKLTFIAHSLGGLIVRSALPQLEEFKQYMHGYLSLGSPHLGYMYNSNSLINAGMWVLKRWRKSQCLQQLSMSDAAQKNNTYLYKLTKIKGLNWFKQVIFCSSYQDNYAPHDSARVQVCSRAAKTDKEKGNIYVKMAQNILDQLQCEKLYRLDINFKIDEKNLDSMIGRTAHILLMECEPLIEVIVNRYKEFFCE